jgi:SRSO17 transposase
MDARELKRLRSDLTAYLDEVAGPLDHPRRRKWCDAYLRGLLLDGHRKSVEPMAARLKAIESGGEDYEQALQQFLNQSPWDEQALLDGLQAWVGRRFGTAGCLIIDDTGFPKQGESSVGVARQYTGTLGKVASCQVAVTLQFATAAQVVALDARLYLPEAWAADRGRAARAGIPDGVGYRPKWEIALDMIRRAVGHGFRGVVLADSLFGTVTEFREQLARDGRTYCVGIDSTLKVIAADADLGPVPPRSRTGRPPTRPAKIRRGATSPSVREWAAEHAEDFRPVTWREGSKGKMTGRFAAWRVRPAHQLSAGKVPLAPCWLLAEWPDGNERPAKYFFSNLPASTSLKRLVAAAKGRWWVEHSYRELKDELGLDHFEGRSWRGWNHHVVLVLMAYAFLQDVRRRRPKKVTPR